MRILILGPESRNKSIKSFLVSKGHDVLVTEDEISVGFLKENEIDFLISSGYAPIVKPPVILAYPKRIINLHISYLPYGKGIYPNFWSFFENTPKGVSIHFIDAGIDTGSILFQKQIDISKDDTLFSTHKKLMTNLEDLFFEHWDDIINGNYKALDQSAIDVDVTYHNRIDSERWLDLLPARWDTPVRHVEDMGAEFALANRFWEAYDDDVSGLVDSSEDV